MSGNGVEVGGWVLKLLVLPDPTLVYYASLVPQCLSLTDHASKLGLLPFIGLGSFVHLYPFTLV